jgi:hypothetical protein
LFLAEEQLLFSEFWRLLAVCLLPVLTGFSCSAQQSQQAAAGWGGGCSAGQGGKAKPRYFAQTGESRHDTFNMGQNKFVAEFT